MSMRYRRKQIQRWIRTQFGYMRNPYWNISKGRGF